MPQELKRICILSGPSDEVDLSRARTGINYHSSLEVKVPFRVLGAGPDLGRALEYFGLLESGKMEEKEYLEAMKNLDHHLTLYRFLIKSGETVETVTTSVTLVQNVLHGFENEQDGRYAIVTEPWHYRKFRMIERSLKGKRRISRGLEFFNVPSPDTYYYSLFGKAASHIKSILELSRI